MTVTSRRDKATIIGTPVDLICLLIFEDMIVILIFVMELLALRGLFQRHQKREYRNFGVLATKFIELSIEAPRRGREEVSLSTLSSGFFAAKKIFRKVRVKTPFTY